MAQRQRRGRHAATGRPARWRLVPGHTLIALLSATVLIGTGIGWGTVGSLERGLHTTDALGAAQADAATGSGDGTTTDDGATDILLVGSDSRTDAEGNPLPAEVLRQLRTEQAEGINTDTIILVRVPEDGSAAHAVSIPRDTLVDIPGKSPDKINSVYRTWQKDAAHQLREQGMTDEVEIERNSAQAGRKGLVKTVTQLTGVRIDHYAEVNLYGFVLLTDAIGGVEVCLNSATVEPGSGADFPAGRQTISGSDALSFVRQRHGLPRGDLDRIVRQQVFLASAVRSVLSTGTLTDPGRLSALASAARRSVVLDADWDMLSFAQQMHGIAAGAVDFVTIPVVNVDGRDERGQSVVTIDPVQVRRFIADLVGAPAPDTLSAPASGAAPGGGPDAGSGAGSGTGAGEPRASAPAAAPATRSAASEHTVDVLNGTQVNGLASDVSNRLVAAGFTAGTVDNTAALRTTVIKVAPSEAAVGARVSELLGGGILVQTDPELAVDRIVILLGADYPARSGNRLTGPALLRLDGVAAPGAPRSVPVPAAFPPRPPINADGVPCIN